MTPQRLLLAISVAILGACATYPVTRTFYEIDPTDGTPKNRASCGYINTKDSAQRIVEGIEIFIAPGKEDVGSNPEPRLPVWMSFYLPDEMGDVAVNPAKIGVVIEGTVLPPEVLSSTERLARRSQGNYKSKWLELRYPPPSGTADRVTFLFQSGALLLNGQPVAVAPFRFSRVTKSDIYYGSINC